jgi:AraC-like DNA-binding protein
MDDRAIAPRKNWLRSLVKHCRLLDEALGQDGPLSAPVERFAALVEKLPRPRHAIEAFVGRCLVARMLLDHRRLDAANGRRERAIRRRIAEYCLDPSRPTDWPDTRALVELVHLLSPGGEPLPDPAGVAADIRRVVVTKYRENLTDSRVASAVGLSRAETARVFRRAYGQSVHDLMSDLRFADAQRLLRSTELKISAVAAEVGYRSPKDLYRLIKSRTGMTPARFREVARPESTDGAASRDPDRPAAGAVQSARER